MPLWAASRSPVTIGFIPLSTSMNLRASGVRFLSASALPPIALPRSLNASLTVAIAKPSAVNTAGRGAMIPAKSATLGKSATIPPASCPTACTSTPTAAMIAGNLSRPMIFPSEARLIPILRMRDQKPSISRFTFPKLRDMRSVSPVTSCSRRAMLRSARSVCSRLRTVLGPPTASIVTPSFWKARSVRSAWASI